MSTKGLSAPATTERVLAELAALDWTNARVLDVGAGRGHFSRALGEHLRVERGLVPAEHVFACDVQPTAFGYADVVCRAIAPGAPLPYGDASFDAVVSIEVIEHVEDQFAFLRELARVCRPGGCVIATTPNTLHLNSRVRALAWGFPSLFDPLPLARPNAQMLGGHIHPIAPYYLAHAALRAGLERPRLIGDRTKASAALLYSLLWPVLLVGRAAGRARLARKHPDVAAENRELLDRAGSFELATARSAVLVAHKPRGGA